MDLGRLTLTIASVAVLIGTDAFGAEGRIGAPYSAREPTACAARSAPAQGGPTSAQAVEILKCSLEGIGDGDLYLVSNVTIQVGQGRALDPRNDYFDNPDPGHMIYPITGSLTRYNCLNVSERAPAGKNCTSFVEANAKGACYKMRSGDWYCSMSDLVQRRSDGVAPPAN